MKNVGKVLVNSIFTTEVNITLSQQRTHTGPMGRNQRSHPDHIVDGP